MFIETKPFGHRELCSETSIPWIKFKINCYSFSTVLDSMSFEAAHEFCKKEGNSFVMVKCFPCIPSWHFSKQCGFLHLSDYLVTLGATKKIGKINTIEFACLGMVYLWNSMSRIEFENLRWCLRIVHFPKKMFLLNAFDL